MGKILVVAEKPSVGKDIAKVLQANKKADGYLYSDNYIVTWAIGHLVTLCDAKDYDERYKNWYNIALPLIPDELKLKASESTRSQLVILHKLFNSQDVDSIICATDSGREGELIFRYIYSIVKCSKPFQRLWISSMTDASIKNGFNNLKNSEEYDNLYLSAKCRSEADWLVGINGTCAFTLTYGTTLSVGRVQTPTLGIIVEKQKEINAFVPMTYWEDKAFFGNFSGVWFDIKTNETKILEKETAEQIKEKVLDKEGVIFSIDVEEKSKPPTPLYDLTELQRDANKKFGFSAKKTLEVAQTLYEKKKLITYPRTDSRYLSQDYVSKLPIILNTLLKTQYEPFAKHILSLNELPITKRIVDDTKITDHHAIIPTEIVFLNKNLNQDEFNIYDLVVRKFLSVFYTNYVYNITKITSLVENEYFLTRGNTIVSLGFMELYEKDTKENKKSTKKGEEDMEILPNVQKGDIIKAEKVDILEKKTKPPQAYTEATLLSAMENAGRFIEDEELKEKLKDSGLGTPATRASVIERLLQIGYIERKGKTVAATEKGMSLIEIVPKELKTPETTGKWEKGLSLIAKGQMEEKRFMDSIKRYVNYLVECSKIRRKDIVFPKNPNRNTERG